MASWWPRVMSFGVGAVVGAAPPDPPPPMTAIRVRCEPDGPPLGPLLAVKERLERLVGPADDPYTRQRGLRDRLLGEPRAGQGRAFLASLEALARRSPQPVVVVLEAFERADAATVELVAAAIGRPGLLGVPVVVGLRSEGALAPLVAAIERAGGPVVRAGAPREAERAPAADAPTLPADPSLRRLLRAAACIGPVFDAAVVARLLHAPPEQVLELLQQAADEGVPVEDLGEGRFEIPARLVEALRRQTLPSLAAAWSRRLGQALSRTVPKDPLGPEAQEARAAHHLEAVGDLQPAVVNLLGAARQAARNGCFPQALGYGEKGVAMAERLPPGEERRGLLRRALTELGRLQWESAGDDADFTLASALATLDRAKALLQPSDPPEVKAGLRELVAAVCYDLGTKDSLERALAEIAEAARELDDAGDALSAARLLVDQAAVEVRLGDVVHATHLVRVSREVFAERAARDPGARAALAETEHLLARLPLHVAVRPGVAPADAYEQALRHAATAEALYGELGRAREQARVRGTMGHLAFLAGRREEAVRWLGAAAEAQEASRDLLGLAATAATLAEVLAAEGRFGDAVGLLGRSIALNREKGSPLGLAYNRRGLERLVGAVPEAERPKLGEAVEALSSGIRAAEAEIGRAELGPDR